MSQASGYRLLGMTLIAIAGTIYLWIMSSYMVPDTISMLGYFGISVATPLVWIGLTVAAIVAAGVFYVIHLISNRFR